MNKGNNKSVAFAIVDILAYIEVLEVEDEKYSILFKVALASILMNISNVFRNGKCLSYRKDWQKRTISRSEVHSKFLSYCKDVLLLDIRSRENIKPFVQNFINFNFGDSRNYLKTLHDNTIDLVITSPPYLNSRDYTDIYRLELWLLGYIKNFEEEKKLRRSALTSHVQIKLPDTSYPQIEDITTFISHLEGLNGSLWNRNIPNMIKGYFNDMEQIFLILKNKVKRDGKIYLNVSNSAYGGIICEVDTILAKIAESNGFTIEEIRIARHINSSKQQNLKEKLRESILVIKNTR